MIGFFKACVNGDISFLWESEKFDPLRIETPNLIEVKYGTVDYVGAKFHANPSMGGCTEMGEIYAQNFYHSVAR